MNNRNSGKPLYSQLIGLVKKGFSTLENENQREVKEFIRSCQHPNGGFTDRGGRSDFYYSLFGVWLSAALDMPETLENHKSFVGEKQHERSGTVDALASLLIRISLFEEDFQKPSFLKLLKMAFRESNQSIFYRLFLFFLVFDAFYQGKMIHFFARIILFFYPLPVESPGSIYAALTLIRYKVGLSVNREKKALLFHFEKGKGFKAFRNVEEADLLSTAVVLFALKATDTDLRMVAPDCLEFIQGSYDSGAFLAGNGDEVRDLEYTFYGLLALGTLI
ncbi:hypothetical protein D1164_17655 [Mariniphaga sediminis]|uniref:Uncharacterized protein n=1 Tax=Mariniphaga sediminis TaxID=1628158 RepID=A0A399CVF8_9BACT|nr:prenyltransferase/squalene oxidase repeat-containing protein [Mariniphaga sediminis]RIH63765.1 hypothetical protein D1164_17655 [Mariniphaga sediminis]